MKEIIDKLIQSDNTDDWLIAYELIIKEYGSFYEYPRKETGYLYLRRNDKQLCKAILINYNSWDSVYDVNGNVKYAQL